MEVYKAVLFGLDDHRIEQSTIRSFGHRVFTVRQQKAGLAAYDDKRFVLPDCISTLAHGHRNAGRASSSN